MSRHNICIVSYLKINILLFNVEKHNKDYTTKKLAKIHINVNVNTGIACSRYLRTTCRMRRCNHFFLIFRASSSSFCFGFRFAIDQFNQLI